MYQLHKCSCTSWICNNTGWWIGINWVGKRLISQLFKDIWQVLQKLPRYFNGTAILTFFVLSAVGFFPVFIFYLNDPVLPLEKLTMLPLLSITGSISIVLS